MHFLISTFVLCLVFQTPSSYANNQPKAFSPKKISSTNIQGAWETGEPFRAQFLFRIAPLSSSDKSTLTHNPYIPAFSDGSAILRIYELNNAGEEVLVAQSDALFTVFNTGNFHSKITLVSTADGFRAGLDILPMRVSNSITLTVKKHQGQIVVAHVEQESSKKKPERIAQCNVDLLSGKRTINGISDTIAALTLPISQWNIETVEEHSLCAHSK